MEDYKYFKNFVYVSCYLYAESDEDGNIKKHVKLPYKWEDINETTYINSFYYRDTIYKKSNAIAVILKKSNISVIDIDDPENFPRIEDLLNDCSFIVQTRKGYHLYFNKCNDLDDDAHYCKIADINPKLLFFSSSYTNETNGEIYNYEVIKKGKLVDIPKYAVDICKSLIAFNDYDNKKTKKPKKQNNKIRNPDIENNIFSIQTMDIIYNILFENKQFENFKTWQRIAWMSRHVNNSPECFKLFHEYSIKVEEYKNNTIENNYSYFYGDDVYTEDFDPNAMLYMCMIYNKDKYEKCLASLHVTKYKNQIIDIYTNKLYIPKYKTEIFDDWINSYKILAIKSAYKTGKTYAFKELMKTNKFKSVLFITYRKSLAYSLINDLKTDFGFCSYLDKETKLKEEKRIIIQLDSILKIKSSFIFKDIINYYDLIVLDEIEGLLNHSLFPKEQYSIFTFLIKLLKKCGKILALDGDMHDRSYDFLLSISDSYKLYNNTFKPDKKRFIFYENQNKFNNLIDKDLIDGKNLVIVCMSKNQSEFYYNKYKDTYPTICHNANDVNSDILKNVNKEWIKYKLVIYTPTIEAGISFDIPDYFYKCYVFLSIGSCSSRALEQMMARVRYYINHDITLFLPTEMKYKNNIPVSYSEINNYSIYKDVPCNEWTDIIKHNDVEEINKLHSFFIVFVISITQKGHTYTIIKNNDDENNEIENDEEIPFNKKGSDISKEYIINAKNLTKSEYEILNRQKKSNIELSRDENYSLEKYIYSSKFIVDINDINMDFMDEHYKNLHIINNVHDLFLSPEKRYKIEHHDIINKLKYKKIDSIRKLINDLGFNINTYSFDIINKLEQEERHKIIRAFFSDKTTIELFKFSKAPKISKNKNEVNKNVIKYPDGHLNKFLFNYGILLETSDQSKININGKRKNIYNKKMTLIPIIKEYIERKNKIDIEKNDCIDAIDKIIT